MVATPPFSAQAQVQRGERNVFFTPPQVGAGSFSASSHAHLQREVPWGGHQFLLPFKGGQGMDTIFFINPGLWTGGLTPF